jgi:hypothetical protein
MNLAYIISAYKLPDQLTRLVNRLATDTTHFFVHVDRSADDAIYSRMVSPMARLGNVHFLDRHRCPYGGFGHVKATLKGINELFRRRIPFDYAILLTGQDYPLRSNEEIADFFTDHERQSFIDHFPLPFDEWDLGGMDRIDSWHVRLGGQHFRFRGPAKLGVTRRFPLGLRPFGGSAYWCLTRECIDYIVRFLQNAPRYSRFFKYVNVPDEIFFQTIVLNSPLRDLVVNDDLRYIEWRERAIAGGPAVLGRGDFNRIMSSPKLFARKFDMTDDAEILDMIDCHIDRL